MAVFLSAAALFVSLSRGDESAPVAPTAPPEPAASASTASEDKALCEAIAPLMTESNRDANAWTELGKQGTPASDAALPEFITKTEAWVPRAQQLLDDSRDAAPAFRRDLQRYIDDIRIYATNVKPGPPKVYDAAAWSDSLMAYFAVKSTCADVGVSW
ncbi:hypothetical protein [Mycobacterium sp. 236(2023)]|uniref:hypothetical protein n=1 Tax=Mycobacterium sp. 236(2023) TaxID=3038163 RepID=UPI002414FBE9|nr:hypothetical protein [Mycobacterium sp. 236(2023)]MDG4667972.1 hypothetical protein [Mycobacterium sp. 236(2023)]